MAAATIIVRAASCRTTCCREPLRLLFSPVVQHTTTSVMVVLMSTMMEVLLVVWVLVWV